MYGLRERFALLRRGRIGMPSVRETFGAQKPWERALVLAHLAGLITVLTVVRVTTGSWLIAVGALLLYLLLGLLISLWILLRAGLCGTEPPGTVWDGGKRSTRRW